MLLVLPLKAAGIKLIGFRCPPDTTSGSRCSLCNVGKVGKLQIHANVFNMPGARSGQPKGKSMYSVQLMEDLKRNLIF